MRDWLHALSPSSNILYVFAYLDNFDAFELWWAIGFYHGDSVYINLLSLWITEIRYE